MPHHRHALSAGQPEGHRGDARASARSDPRPQLRQGSDRGRHQGRRHARRPGNHRRGCRHADRGSQSQPGRPSRGTEQDRGGVGAAGADDPRQCRARGGGRPAKPAQPRGGNPWPAVFSQPGQAVRRGSARRHAHGVQLWLRERRARLRRPLANSRGVRQCSRQFRQRLCGNPRDSRHLDPLGAPGRHSRLALAQGQQALRRGERSVKTAAQRPIPKRTKEHQALDCRRGAARL